MKKYLCIICGSGFESEKGNVRTCSTKCSMENRRRITASWFKSTYGKMWVERYNKHRLKIDSLLKCLQEAPLLEKAILEIDGGLESLKLGLKLNVVRVDGGMVYLEESPYLKVLTSGVTQGREE